MNKEILFQEELEDELKKQGADFVHFANISTLQNEQNKNFPYSILIGITLSPEFIQQISNEPDYMYEMYRTNQLEKVEFYIKEHRADELADFTENYLIGHGYQAYSQSEKNLLTNGDFNAQTKSTPLPHKTIARLSGFGWIGKHNLLVTETFGSAICMCTVLTNAPLRTEICKPMNSFCKDCNICKDICFRKAIKGNIWKEGISRDEIVDVNMCSPCLKCLAHCPWTQKYMKKNL